MTRIVGIYSITNMVNNKVYVGSSINISKRWSGHKTSLRSRTHHSSILQSSWNKYGEQSFLFSIIEIVENPLDIIRREQFWIDTLGSAKRGTGLNVRPVAESPAGLKHYDETKLTISMNNLGKKRPPVSDDTKAKISKANLGKKISLEGRLKMTAYRLGRKRKPFTNEHKKNISLSKIGVKMPLSTKPRKPRTQEHKDKLSASMFRFRKKERLINAARFPVSG